MRTLKKDYFSHVLWLVVLCFLTAGCELIDLIEKDDDQVPDRDPEEVVFQRLDIETEDGNRFSLLHFLSPDDIVAATNIYTYNDGGDLYLSSNNGVNFETTREYVAPLRGSFSFVDQQNGYVAGWRSGFGVSMFIGKTTDGGQTWDNLMDTDLSNLRDLIPVNIDPRNIVARGNSVYFVTGGREGPGRIFASSQAGLGGSWEREINEVDFYTWTLDLADDMIYIATHTDFMVKNPGSDWQTLPAPWDHEGDLELTDMTFASSSRGWALIEDDRESERKLSLYYTSDGGESWGAKATSRWHDFETVFPNREQLLYFDHMLFGVGRLEVDGSSDRLYILASGDNGQSWVRNEWTEHRNWGIRLVDAAGELRVYQHGSGRYHMDYYGVYDP